MQLSSSVLPISIRDQLRREAEEVFYNSYKCRQLYTLIQSGRFQPSLTWLSDKLNVEPRDLAVFLDALLTLDLIKRTPDGFAITKELSTEIRKIEPAEHAALTQDLLGEIQEHGSESLFLCVATDESLRQEFMEQFKALLNKFCQKSRSSTRNLIYSVSLSTTKIKEQGDTK